MPTFRTLDEADLAGKRVLVRVDLNVPMDEGRVTDDTRIQAILPTIRAITEKGGKAILLSHFGRPKGRDASQSLAPVAAAVGERLGAPVAFAGDCIGSDAEAAVSTLAPGAVLVLENTRFHAGEEKNAADFVQQLAALGDIYVNDAFSAAHRAHASTEGLAHKLPAFAGRSMQKELEALAKALEAPQRPVLAVVGGAKVSSKLELLGNLTAKVDILVIGGGMANTFLAAKGVKVGKSLCEHDLADTARQIIATAASHGCEIVLPVDAVVTKTFAAHADHRVVPVDQVAEDEMILDAGPATVALVREKLKGAKTVVWNGPFGAFELPPFDAATVAVAKAVAEATKAGALLSVAGGGDTVAALNHAGAAGDFSYVSTAGGAFLEWLEGKQLPGVEALRR
ncbi:phosphoglycerate kinase [Azorhizobium caulinodans ORS 571]|uniref:Phosphoglycerate kinase n=1 Tax=Azorhizobium caulinodans (strain ATCC 43989 / DSM 5975 / JCM 20966 / LMG 6465 / NBRC 14845 / NCIMB 13405 / ORS 571) TaxID=438753 RepID=PGK_AZOC5|nr:phosphoglycerate kinase [Azorhizobium caulinodans]A8IM75.1 RecName: Full=Phosphoglycerate kinase [Azorhizobium caulinodans ORS 571]BAF86500.1 phosphoglycerate kinase [Azorhizobium caulinodans ORS 571]